MSENTPIPSAAAPPDPDLSGRQLGDYRILRRIGRGAMAEVYLAEQSSLQRQVAVKVLKRSLAADASYVQRFQNEARAAAALVQANIVQIYEVGQRDGVHFIAQEYISGQNLRQLLDRHGPFDAALAITVMRQVAAALHKAAGKGIVHRDIKPENIMITSAGEVKVADFGLSRIAEGGSVDLTQVGVTMGTPLYMSPEQAEGQPLDSRSDLYSFGVTMYHVLAGRPPFSGETPLAVAVQHVRSQPERLENIRTDLPQGLCRIVHRLLEKQPDQRYPSAAQLLQDLRGLGIGDGDGAWSEAIEDWSEAELIALADARVVATQQLDTLMKTAAHKRGARQFRWRATMLGMLLAFLLGAGIAWQNREPQLLAGGGNGQPTAIARQANGQAQYWHAMGLETPAQREAGFQAVLHYYPQDEYHANLARQQLARIHLQRDEFEPALALFQTLSDSADLDERLQAFGLAGQILCYDRMNQPRKASELIAQVAPLKNQLDPQMRSELDAVIKRLELESPLG